MTTTTNQDNTFYGQDLEMPGTMVIFFTAYRSDQLDENTGLYMFEIPMTSGEASEINFWEEQTMNMGLIINVSLIS